MPFCWLWVPPRVCPAPRCVICEVLHSAKAYLMRTLDEGSNFGVANRIDSRPVSVLHSPELKGDLPTFIEPATISAQSGEVVLVLKINHFYYKLIINYGN